MGTTNIIGMTRHASCSALDKVGHIIRNQYQNVTHLIKLGKLQY